MEKIQNIELGNVTREGKMVNGAPYTMHNRVSYMYDGVFYERLIGDTFVWYDDDDQIYEDVIVNIQYVKGEVVIIPRRTGRLDLIDLHDY